ncbi:class I SAM-dependent methyltransferase [Paraburkholderia diazotrophica]|uniref:class I SAM-dependent methyltransferase n=1 Tax=Paraburkholderia diazotrophica TaxID=667676 RepID=UPI0031778E9E
MMHPTAMMNCTKFFEAYADSFLDQQKVRVIEIGSQDVNGGLRGTAPASFEYIGVDFVEGKGVDVVLDDPYSLPFESESADIILSSSCFEHSEMFWLVFLEIMRVLKPKGLLYMNAPSNGPFHRYPVDCWRFYPDSGRALVTWAKRNAMNVALLESYVSAQVPGDIWNDFVAVFVKDEAHAEGFPKRILNAKTDISNGVVRGIDEFVNQSAMPEDMRKLMVIGQIVENKIRIN